MNRLPDFLIVGAAKSGTTALYHYLNQHPEIFLSPIKETNFFALKGKEISFRGPNDNFGVHRRTITNIRDYYKQFVNVADEKAVGEICPAYLYFEDTAKNIQQYIPNAKIIVVLREPIERAFSAWVHLKRDGREKLSFKDALADESRRIKDNWAEIWHYQAEGMYYTQLKRYYDTFPKENIKVILYEDFKQEPALVYSEICNFIGVDNSFVPDMTAKHNTGSFSSINVLTYLFMKKNYIKSFLKKVLPISLRNRIKKILLMKNIIHIPIISKDDRDNLKEVFSQETRNLEELIGIKLKNWK